MQRTFSGFGINLYCFKGYSEIPWRICWDKISRSRYFMQSLMSPKQPSETIRRNCVDVLFSELFCWIYRLIHLSFLKTTTQKEGPHYFRGKQLLITGASGNWTHRLIGARRTNIPLHHPLSRSHCSKYVVFGIKLKEIQFQAW